MTEAQADNKLDADVEVEGAMGRKKRHRCNVLFWASHNRWDHSRDRGQSHPHSIDVEHPFDQTPHTKASCNLKTPDINRDKEEL